MENVQKKLVEIQNERSSCYLELDAGAAALQEIRVFENTARMNVEQLREQKRSADENFRQFGKESAELDRQASEIQEMKRESQKELKDSEAMEKAHTCAVETYQSRLEEERLKEAKAQKLLEEYHLDTASIQQKTEFAASSLNRVEGELKKLQNEQEELVRSRSQAEEDSRSREAGIHALQEELDQADQAIRETEEKIQELQKKKEEQSASHKNFFGRREEQCGGSAPERGVYRSSGTEEKLRYGEGRDTESGKCQCECH